MSIYPKEATALSIELFWNKIISAVGRSRTYNALRAGGLQPPEPTNCSTTAKNTFISLEGFEPSPYIPKIYMQPDNTLDC